MAKRKKLKGLITVEELNAYKIAYGDPLERKEVLLLLIKAFLVAFVFTYSLFHYWWLGLITGLIGAVYSYAVILPQSVKRIYENNAFRERNNFVNNMTQLLTNPDRTIRDAIKVVCERASGEFKEDLLMLQADLMGAHNEVVQEAFAKLTVKYKNDVIFAMYIEQLITAAIEGRTSIETIKDIKTWHNETKKIQDNFYAVKARHAYEFKFVSIIIVILIGAVMISFGFRQFIDVYAHNLVGWLFSSLFLALYGMFFHRFIVHMGDDKIMEVKV